MEGKTLNKKSLLGSTDFQKQKPDTLKTIASTLESMRKGKSPNKNKKLTNKKDY